MKVTVCRKEQFNAAHRLYRKDWTDEQNKSFYGGCSNPNYHGHNYKLEVQVKGEVDQKTGFVMDLKALKIIVQEEVINPFDHRNLNLDVPDFQELIPTTENMAVVIWNRIRPRLDAKLDLCVVLGETDKNKVIYEGT